MRGNFYFAGNTTKSQHYQQLYTERQQKIQSVFWDAQAGQWFDYWLSSDSRHNVFYPSNMFPLFVGCASGVAGDVEKVLNYLQVMYTQQSIQLYMSLM